MLHAENKRILEIICENTAGPQLIKLARRLSELLHHRKVEICAARRGISSAPALRTHLSDSESESYWPQIRSLLRAEDLLSKCQVYVENVTTNEVSAFWPLPEN